MNGKIKKFGLYAPAAIVLAAIMVFGGGEGEFFGAKTAFGYGANGGGQRRMTSVVPQVAGASIENQPIQPLVEAASIVKTGVLDN